MSKTIRIDEETYRLATINAHQQNALSEIFTKLSAVVKKDFTIIFEYDSETLTISTSAWIIGKGIKIELPFLVRKNRLFREGNILIPEKFLFSGENMIYILRDIMKPYEDELSFKMIVSHLKCFEFESKNEENNV